MEINYEFVQCAVYVILIIIHFLVFWRVLISSFDRNYVFISYAEEDKSRVEFAVEVIKKQLKSSLRNGLRNTYRVLTVSDIPPGSMMPDAKRMCIERADVCIVFLSDNYIKNNDCCYEFNLMDYLTVIPIFLNCDEDINKYSSNIINRKGIFLDGCYSHRLIKDKLMLLTKELCRRNNC